MRWQMQVTLKEPLIFEGLERARFWSSHGTLQREIAPHNPCAVFSLFSLVCLQVMSASRISRSRKNVLKPTWWLACQGFSRTCSEIDGGLALWVFGQMASGDLRMEGDIRFIAARSFWQPCVSVKGNASMFGNIHFEGCRNKDQDSPRSQTRFAWSVGILGSPSKEDWGGSFNPGVFSGEPNSVQQTDNHLNSSLDIKLNTVEHLRAWLPWFFLFLSPRFGFKEAINSWNVRTQGSVADWWFWGWLAVT